MQLADLQKYDYVLPSELIRAAGVEPRDSARLFIYDTVKDEITFDVFRNIAQYVPERALLVLNDTRVLPVRLWLSKETGGKVEVFVLMNQYETSEHIPVLVDRKVVIGQKLMFPGGDYFEVIGQDEQVFFVRLISLTREPIISLLEQFGRTPVPHYLEDTSVSEETMRLRYQTVFARTGASVAAPTAGLHFTEAVFASLAAKHIHSVSVTLDIGRGTFASLREENFVTRTLHTEHISVSESTAKRLNQARKETDPIVAIGTTALRTLETMNQNGRFGVYTGPTNIFVFPPYRFRGADILLTNFHLPRTSLMLLVEAFLRDKGAKRGVLELYQIAILNRFSFYSFGDSMLIL